MNTEEMLGNVIGKYGFEAEQTIWFAERIEEFEKGTISDIAIDLMYDVIMKGEWFNVLESDDEE